MDCLCFAPPFPLSCLNSARAVCGSCLEGTFDTKDQRFSMQKYAVPPTALLKNIFQGENIRQQGHHADFLFMCKTKIVVTYREGNLHLLFMREHP